MSGPYGAAALGYVERGWAPLPIPAGKKAPPPDGYTGAAGRAPTVAEVRRWVDTDGGGNVALDATAGGRKAARVLLFQALRQIGGAELVRVRWRGWGWTGGSWRSNTYAIPSYARRLAESMIARGDHEVQITVSPVCWRPVEPWQVGK